MLVVLEGLDGAGKSTQVKMFREYLENICPKVEYIHFPRYDSAVYGELIGKFLRGGFGPIDKVHPQLVALLYAEDRHNAAGILHSAIDAGSTVLLDRYVYSNIAYQCAKVASEEEAEELRKWISDTEYGHFNLPRPDLNLFLDVPISFVENNLASERNGNDRDYLNGGRDIHEKDIAFQKRVREMYHRQAALDRNFVIVDCSDQNGEMLPADKIFQKLKVAYENHQKA